MTYEDAKRKFFGGAAYQGFRIKPAHVDCFAMLTDALGMRHMHDYAYGTKNFPVLVLWKDIQAYKVTGYMNPDISYLHRL
mgnify:CR=1 FL=1